MEHSTRQAEKEPGKDALRDAAALLEREPLKALYRLQSFAANVSGGPAYQILLARTLIALERHLDAAGAAERALEAGAMTQEVLSLRLHALSHGGDYAELERVVELGMTQPRLEFRNVLAMAQSARLLGQSELAGRLYTLLIRSRPDDASLRARLGVIHGSRGEVEEAAQCFAAALDRDPAAAQVRYQLSCLKRQTPADNNLSALRAARAAAEHAAGASPRQRACLAYALGKELEDLEEYPAAFACYAEGARAERAQISYSLEDERRLYEGVKALHQRLETDAQGGFGADQPIFIAGLPRTGSTLIDTILSRHSQVVSAGELPTFREALKAELGFADGRDTLRQLIAADVPGIDFRRLGERYLAMARTQRMNGLRFTDKMPGNHLLLGLIAQALPEARLICVERDPADTCMSTFKQLFAPGSYSWSYDLEETARHCLLHHDLTRFWIGHLAGRVLQVDYEELVTAPEVTARRILAFCGLDWEDACLDPAATRGAVNTASAAQVRQPIYTSSVGKWRRYGTELEPALRVLRSEDPDS